MNTPLTQSTVLPLASGLTLCDDGLIRPTWASHDELLRSYYDAEWGLPVHDEVGVFERLVLEEFQAGLSWRTVLAKRGAFRAAFAGFSPDRVAAFTESDQQRSCNGRDAQQRRQLARAHPPGRARLVVSPDVRSASAFAGRGADAAARVGGARQGPERQRIPFCRPDDNARAHGGNRHREYRYCWHAPQACLTSGKVAHSCYPHAFTSCGDLA